MISIRSATDFTATVALYALPTLDRAQMQAIVDSLPTYETPPPVEIDKRLTDPAKKAADLEKKQAQAWEKLAERNAIAEAARKSDWLATASSPLLGGFIFAIAVGLGNGEIQTFDIKTHGSVAGMLEAFWRYLAHHTVDETRGIQTEGMLPSVYRPVIVAHGVDALTRYVAQSSLQNRVKVPCWWPVGVGAFSDRVFDTEVEFVGPGGKLGLDAMCAHLKIPAGAPVDLVTGYEPDGENAAIVTHVTDTVRRVRCLRELLVGMEPDPRDLVELGGVPETDDETEPHHDDEG